MTGRVSKAYDALAAEGRITPDPAQQAVLPLLDELCARAEATPAQRGLRGLLARNRPEPAAAAGRGLYLWGGVGTGKSMLMDLLAETVNAPVRRVHFHAFMQEIHAGLDQARTRGESDALLPVARAVLRDVSVLAFDEMQIGDIADAMIVGRLFQAILETGVIVVATSNRPPDDLYKDGLNRGLFLPFIALLKERLLVHELAGSTDYRRIRVGTGTTYFTPADTSARSAIDALWRRLTEGRERPLTLRIQGRELTLERHSGGAARAAFWELCARPLGAADYLALADALRLLVLEDVPRLGRSNYNEARRFVTLIDALYEARVRLVISAADRPERLYVEGEGTFEFERTASRLNEMQTPDWGR